MSDVSPRIQRITIHAWQYEFEPQHIPGRNNVISDALSRVTLLEFQDSNAEKDILAVNFLQYSSIEERERDEVLQETNKDKELQSLKHYHFYRLASKKKPDSGVPFIPTGSSELNSR